MAVHMHFLDQCLVLKPDDRAQVFNEPTEKLSQDTVHRVLMVVRYGNY